MLQKGLQVKRLLRQRKVVVLQNCSPEQILKQHLNEREAKLLQFITTKESIHEE